MRAAPPAARHASREPPDKWKHGLPWWRIITVVCVLAVGAGGYLGLRSFAGAAAGLSELAVKPPPLGRNAEAANNAEEGARPGEKSAATPPPAAAARSPLEEVLERSAATPPASGDVHVVDGIAAVEDRARVVLFAQAGSCAAGERDARAWAARGGVDGVHDLMRFDAACKHDAAEPRALHQALLSEPALSPADRALTDATLALAELRAGTADSARAACAGLTAHADAAARRALARCQLAAGTLKAIDAGTPFADDDEGDATVRAAAALKAGIPLRDAPAWWRGPALARALRAAEKGGPRAAVVAATTALLAAPWSGAGIPSSAQELHALVEVAQPSQRPFGHALAAALANDPSVPTRVAGAFAPLLAGARAFVAHDDAGLTALRPALQKAPDLPLRRLLLAATDDAGPTRDRALRTLIADASVGPAAALLLVRGGQKLADLQLEGLDAPGVVHPAFVALRAVRDGTIALK